MAGRPIDPAAREARKKEVDAAIELLRTLGKPATRKNIANEIGISVQNLYGAGYLSVYVKELENNGQICTEESLIPRLSAAEVKQLQRENQRLRAENERLKKRCDQAQESLIKQKKEVQSLSQQLLTTKGELFKQQQFNFANSRI